MFVVNRKFVSLPFSNLEHRGNIKPDHDEPQPSPGCCTELGLYLCFIVSELLERLNHFVHVSPVLWTGSRSHAQIFLDPIGSDLRGVYGKICLKNHIKLLTGTGLLIDNIVDL